MGTLYEIALAEAKAKEKQGLEREREKQAGNGKTQPSDDKKTDEPIKDGEGDQPQGSSALKNHALMETARHH